MLTYAYDKRRRLEHQKVTTLVAPTDGAVRRISYTLNTSGELEKITSYDAASGGTVVNEVKLTYDGFGRLTKDEQDHDSAVGVGTLL